MTAYLSGPVTGKPGNNAEAFEDVASSLERIGFETVVPTRIVPAGVEWHAAMRICIPALMHCDIVVMLPGWQESDGAQIERRLAHALDIPVLYMEQTQA